MELVGLEVGNYAVKIAQLGGNPQNISLKVLDREILPPVETQEKKDQAILSAITQLYQRNQINEKKVAITVPALVTTVKKMQIPKVDPLLLREAVYWEAEQYLPFNLAEFQLDYHLLPENHESPYHQLLLVAVPKAAIDHTVRLIQKAGLKPTVVDIPAFALENQFTFNYFQEKASAVCIIDIGARSTLINILLKGNTVIANSLPIGGDNYTQIIQNKSGVDYITAEDIKRQINKPNEIQEILQNISAKFGNKLRQFLDSCKPALNGAEIERIYLCGGGCLLEGITNHLEDTLNKKVLFLNPLRSITLDQRIFPVDVLKPYLTSMAIAIGLGLRRWST